MNHNDFHALTHLILDAPEKPPAALFANGFDDWHCRARLAHFLAQPKHKKRAEALELFRSIVESPIDEEHCEDVEEKVFALQKLSSLEREDKQYDQALSHIDQAIELADATDYLYKYILRGELWADRWVTLHFAGQTKEAEAEADERIAAFEDLPIPHNSYLYYAYRFKAQLAAERGVTLVAKDFMHMALSFMEIPEAKKKTLDEAFRAQHDNASWILNQIDLATPNPDHVHWDI